MGRGESSVLSAINSPSAAAKYLGVSVAADKEIANDRDGKLRWGRKQYATLEQLYRGAPYFGMYAPALREIAEGVIMAQIPEELGVQTKQRLRPDHKGPTEA